METEKGERVAGSTRRMPKKLYGGNNPTWFFECSCQMSRTSEKQVKIRRNNNARAQWRCIFKWASGRRRVYRSLKGTNGMVVVGKEKSENQR